MIIKAEILDYTFDLLAIHQPATIAGEYDGETGTITMTFVGDPNTYELDFLYRGSSYNGFRESVVNTAGSLVAEHNTFMGIPNRDAFIESVTE
jgi:hypothetical protein